jgi:ATP phosphoribosyltransferase regulatory subunit
MTLYPDAVLRAAPPAPVRPRVFLAEGQDGAAIRAGGHATVAQLSAGDTPEGLRCTHILDASGAVRATQE